MANWILTQKGTVIPLHLIHRPTLDEYSVLNEVEMAKRSVFHPYISSKLGDFIKLLLMAPPKFSDQDWDAEPYDDDEIEKPL